MGTYWQIVRASCSICISLGCVVGNWSDPAKGKLLVVRDQHGNERPIKTAAEWIERRKSILAAMQEVMGPLPDRSRLAPLDVNLVEETKGPLYIRRKLT